MGEPSDNLSKIARHRNVAEAFSALLQEQHTVYMPHTLHLSDNKQASAYSTAL